IHVSEPVEGEFSIAFEAFRRRVAVNFVIVLVARFAAHGIDQAAAAGDELQAGVEESAVESVFERLVKIADSPEFFLDIALFDFFGEGTERLRRGVASFERIENSFGGEHATLYRHVDAFEALRIEEAAGISDDQ